MDTIASFEINHLTLKEGIYISRIDDDIVTYDLRITLPNKFFLDNDCMHTIEHLFAVYSRNHKIYGKHIIYFGPMGCRTGFYLLVRNLSHEKALELTKEAFLYIKDYNGIIPGTTEIECGNYKEHSLSKAKQTAGEFYNKIKNNTIENLTY